MLEPLNHPVGTLDLATVSPVRVGTDPFDPIALPGTEIHVAIFEAPYAEVISQLPPSLHPSTPAYATLTFFRVPESPIGAFEFAAMAIACRSTIRPRMMVLSSFASTDAAVELLGRRFGFAARKAEIRTRLRYDAGHSEIVLDGRKIAEVVSADPERLLGGSRALRYPQTLNHAHFAGRDGLLQFDVSYVYDESYRGILSLPVFDADALTGGKVHPTDMMAGTYARLESATLLQPRLLIDPRKVGEVFKADDLAEAA